ncbi:MAG: aldolase [Chloroflexi bacterium]|nr:aldolase [Chloroflexota bacterium]MBU1749609.1 aldolase [Chloroflexota bacterium]MBU1878588.1 aldolase [Chloroflexota bacterium]
MDPDSSDDHCFETADFFPRCLFDRITEVRVSEPQVVRNEAAERLTRKELTVDGKLTILAADHPGGRITRVGEDPVALGDRYEYLGRILRILTGSAFDGLMGTPDIIEELLIVNYLIREGGGAGFIDGKVLLGSMNLGGLAGTSFELDNRLTAFTAEAIDRLKLDGAKLRIRIADDDPAAAVTMERCATAINELLDLDVPVFLELLPVSRWDDGRLRVMREPDALIQALGVAAALGDSSLDTWVMVTYCSEFEQVTRATTLPILLLGGESWGDPAPVLREFAAGMAAGPNVRGVMVGRNVLFPGPADPLAVARAIHSIVHDGLTADAAMDVVRSCSGEDMDALSRWVP